MYKKIKPLFALLILSAFYGSAFSQRYNYSTADEGYSNLDHDVYYNGNTILDVNYTSFGKQKNLQATTCNNDLKNIKTSDISGIGKNTYRFSFFNREKLYFFCSDKDESLYKYEINSKDFSAIGSPEKIFSFENDVTEYATAYSQDSSFFSIICRHHNKKDENEIFSGLVMDKAMATVTKFSFTGKEPLDNFVNIQYIVSRNGLLDIICQLQEKARKKKDADLPYYNITRILKNGTSESGQVMGIINGGLQSINWYLNGDKLMFNGLTGDAEKRQYTSVISGGYNYADKKIEGLSTMEFSKSGYAAKSSDLSVKEIVENGLPANAFLKGANKLEDNSTLLVYDLTGDRSSAQYSPPGMSTIYNSKVTYSYGGESYVIKLDAENKIEWFHAIAKTQEEPGLHRFTGINYAIDSRGGIHIFFHDNTDNAEVFPKGKVRLANVGNINKHSLAVVHINASGEIGKKFLGDDSDFDFKMLPGNSSFFQNNELIFIGFKPKAIAKYATICKITISK